MHILLFGGAFDPPHNGHLHIAAAVTSQHIADEVWFIPCAQHPFGKTMSPAADRLAMLQAADHLTISTYEIDKPTTSFTIDTIEYFAQSQPENTFSWLIGSDQLSAFSRWHRWQDLVNMWTVFVYPRQDFPFSPLEKGMVALHNVPMVTISSTQIRELVRSHQPFEHLVSPAVADYIGAKDLYAE